MKLQKAAFIDRDGTFLINDNFLLSLDDYQQTEKAAEGVLLLQDAGFFPVFVTNQSGVARGLYPESFVEEVRLRLEADLKKAGVHEMGHFYCPHHPEQGEKPYRAVCECRKPKAGMIHQARERYHLDLASSVMIGDSLVDCQMAQKAELPFCLVETGHGRKTKEEIKALSLPKPYCACPTLYDVALILAGR